MKKRSGLARPLFHFENIQPLSAVVRRKSLKKRRTTSGVHSKKSSQKIRSTARSFPNCQMNSHPNGNLRSNPTNSTEELAVALNLSPRAAWKRGPSQRFRGHREFPCRGEGRTLWC